MGQIKSEVVRQGQFINFLIKEVDSAAFRDISDVETFVKWLDEELSSLVDERAVLKHFPQWPEQKTDTMREAAFSYRDLRNLEFEVMSFQDNQKEPLTGALRRMQGLQDRRACKKFGFNGFCKYTTKLTHDHICWPFQVGRKH